MLVGRVGGRRGSDYNCKDIEESFLQKNSDTATYENIKKEGGKEGWILIIHQNRELTIKYQY